jgi:hypothetical protein
MVDFGFRQGLSEFSTAPVRSAGPTGQAGIARAIPRIENEGERRRGPKDAVYVWTLPKAFDKFTNRANAFLINQPDSL